MKKTQKKQTVRRKQTSNAKAYLTLYVPLTLRQSLEKIAEKKNRSLTFVATEILEAAFSNRKVQDALDKELTRFFN